MVPAHDDQDRGTVRRSIFVIGGSAGGIEALRAIVSRLPSGFGGAVLVVQHLNRRVPSALADILGRSSPLPATMVFDGQPIEVGTIYVCPPDYHMMVERGAMRLSRSPTQHRNRPALDVTFRSAAVTYQAGAVGVLLSGVLDDGRAGMAAIKACGGVAVVQDPSDAQYPTMPRSALSSVEVDYCLPAADIAWLCATLASGPAAPSRPVPPELVHELCADRGEDLEDHAGQPSPFACPECHGVLWEGEPQGLKQYRCRIGHAYSPLTLADALDGATEDVLWAAVRSLEERSNLARRMAQHWRDRDQPELAQQLEDNVTRLEQDAARVRSILLPPVEKG